jgi:hypothetical protein
MSSTLRIVEPNSAFDAERRFARTLPLFMRYGTSRKTSRERPRISQQALAQMIGTTRSRVNVLTKQVQDAGLHRSTAGERERRLTAALPC